MTALLHARAKAVFLAALEQPAPMRAAYVIGACGGDAALQSEVESLLSYHDEPSSQSAATTALLLPQVTQPISDRAAAAASERVASHLVSRAAQRLEVVCLLTFVAVVVLWLFVNLVRGQLATEFRSPHQWGPPALALGASAAMLWAARSRRFDPSTLVRLGLGYEVVVSGALTGAAYFGTFEGMAATDVVLDRIGLSYVAPWTLFFTVLVPARPRDALIALALSASTVPLVYLQQVHAGMAPALDAQQFLPIFVWPYLVGTVLSYIAARVVHQLGVEVRRAQELGGYRLQARLGRGGMGDVWRGSHPMLARPAAIKVIRRDALAADPVAAEAALARFTREAQVIASLQSPHTVELYDFGISRDGAPYYVMELLEGIDLDACVRRYGPLPAPRVVHLLLQVCESLAEAHARGLVHRDVKPANLFLCRRGLEHDVVKVLDFGLVNVVRADAPAGGRRVQEEPLAGTPEFMAPEITAHAGVDGRTDIYALGCVAFFLLTGSLPFHERTPMATVLAHVHQPPISPSAATTTPIPPRLDELVLACMAKDPANRPPSIPALAERLATAHTGPSWTAADARRWWDERPELRDGG